MVENIALPFRKLLVYVCKVEIVETLVCLMLTLKVETVLPLDAINSDTDMYNGHSVSLHMISWYLILSVHSFINCLNL